MRPSVVMADLSLRLPVAELHTRTESRGSRLVVHIRADVRPFVRAIRRLQWRLFLFGIVLWWNSVRGRFLRWRRRVVERLEVWYRRLG